MRSSPAAVFAALALALFVAAPTCVRAQISTSDCTLITDPAPVPPLGVICGSPERIGIIVSQHWDAGSAVQRVNFRGYQLWIGTYRGMPMFAMNHEIGGAGATFVLEELIAHGAKVVIRLGTADFPVTPADADKVFVVSSERGMAGVLRDYGYPPSMWAAPFPADPIIVGALLKVAPQLPNITAVKSAGYSIDGYYAMNFPDKAAFDPAAVRALAAQYTAAGATVREMECGSVLALAQLRKIHAACVLQCVVKGGHAHASPGTSGIPLVLETLYYLNQTESAQW
jgi:uridine phosphorylase